MRNGMTSTGSRWRSIACAGILTLGAAACSDPLPSPSVLVKLRLMAITADHPDLLPGSSVQLHAVWVDASPHVGRPIWFLWRLCATGAGADPRACLAPAAGSDLAPATIGDDTRTIAPGDFPAPPTTPDYAAGVPYTVILVMCPDQAPVYDPSGGQYACPSEAQIPFAQQEGIQATRQLTIRNAPLDQDPTIDHVTVGGMPVGPGVNPLPSFPPCPVDGSGNPTCAGVPIILYPAAGSAETYGTSTGPMTESLLASFFVTAGSTDRPRAVANSTSPDGADGALTVTWYPPPTATDTVAMWFVLHDGRGGDTAAQGAVQVR